MLVSSPRTRRRKVYEPPILLGLMLLVFFFWLKPRMAISPILAMLVAATWILPLAWMLWLPWKLRIADRVEERDGQLWIKRGNLEAVVPYANVATYSFVNVAS